MALQGINDSSNLPDQVCNDYPREVGVKASGDWTLHCRYDLWDQLRNQCSTSNHPLTSLSVYICTLGRGLQWNTSIGTNIVTLQGGRISGWKAHLLLSRTLSDTSQASKYRIITFEWFSPARPTHFRDQPGRCPQKFEADRSSKLFFRAFEAKHFSYTRRSMLRDFPW